MVAVALCISGFKVQAGSVVSMSRSSEERVGLANGSCCCRCRCVPVVPVVVVARRHSADRGAGGRDEALGFFVLRHPAEAFCNHAGKRGELGGI